MKGTNEELGKKMLAESGLPIISADTMAGVNPKKAGEDFEGVPIFASVKDAKADTGATVSVIYAARAARRHLGSRRGRTGSGDLHHRRHPGP